MIACLEMFVTSTVEVPQPCGSEFILSPLYDLFDFAKL